MAHFDDPIIEEIYQRGQRRIDAMVAALPADGVIALPFHCGGCLKMRCDFVMIDGDGLPICQACIDGCVAAIQGILEAKA